MKLVYCIEHENMFEVTEEVCFGEGHAYVVGADAYLERFEYDFCCLPLGFASCPPPEVPEADEVVGYFKAPEEPEVPYLEREPYREDLLEFHAEMAQAEAELLVELITQEV